jgi:hypothetical protein
MNKVNFYNTLKEAFNNPMLKEIFLYKIKEACHKELSYYRQKKEDFIARIATDWPKWGCGLDFFTFFIQPLFRNPFLWHFINLSDDIALSQIHIKYGYMDDSNIKWVEPKILIEERNKRNNKETTIQSPDLVDYAIGLIEEWEINGITFKITQQIENFKSFLVRIRDADIGAQAFFSFLEGVIRNAAKHRIRSDQKDNLEIRIVLCKDENSLEKLFDKNSELPSVPKDDKSIYVIISVNTDILKVNGKNRTIQEEGKDKPLIEFLREKFQSEIINAIGEITPGNWGLKEMKICAAFLSGVEIEKVNSKEPDYIWITKAPSKIWDDTVERFAYILRLEKPRYVLAIVSEDKKPEDLNAWDQQGIKVISLNEIKNVNFDYDFLYLDETIELPEDINLVLLPQRQIKDNINIKTINNPLEFLYQVYDLHLQKLINQNKYKIVIYFEDDNKARVWTGWSQNWSSNKRLQNVKLEFPQGAPSNADEVMQNTRDEHFKIGILRHRGINSLENLLRPTPYTKIYYQEHASYADLFFSFFSNIDPNHLGDLIIRQLVESTIMNVLVIDERIAKALTTAEVNDASGKVKLEEKLYWMGIYVAKSVKANSKEFNYIGNLTSERMIEVDFDEIKETENNKIYEIIERDKNNEETRIPIHILLIHVTRLNEIAKAYNMSNNELVDTIKKAIPYVIVHSGRGKTKGDIPTNAPFIEYSTIQRYLLQQPSKFFLVQIALSTKGGN